MQKKSWVDKKTNEEILNMVQEDRKILNTIRCHKHKWMGHVSLWHNGFLRDVLEGRIRRTVADPGFAKTHNNFFRVM